MTRHPLIGSERQPLPGAHAAGPVDAAERLEVTVLLRRRNDDALRTHVAGLARGSRIRQRPPLLSREAFEREFGADWPDIEAVRRFADWHGLHVVQEHLGRRTMVLSGTAAKFEDAFGVTLQRFEHANGAYRGRTGAIQLPDELQGRVQAVLGLDNRPAAQPRFRLRVPRRSAGAAADPASFTPVQLAALYDFPPGTGAGECVALIELGGGERPIDLKTYFAGLDLPASPAVTALSVDHARNHPTGNAQGPDGEVMLDIEVVGAIAPQARIAVYFAPNTDAGFLDAITTAIHDTANAPSVISISWGGPESGWTQQAMTAFDQAFQAAATMGITVCVASGDNGSSDGAGDGADHVDFPASSPHALACGGTRTMRPLHGAISETVWNDGGSPGSGGGGASGGGVSTVFARPDWQAGLMLTKTGGGSGELAMRGVPDIAGNADPETGYDVRIDGTDTVIGGTSAVAPLWAGLIARINAATGRPVGFINPTLYANPTAMNDITSGNNGSFAAATGWDACTGLGTPDGKKISAALT